MFHVLKNKEASKQKLMRLAEYPYPEDYIAFPGCCAIKEIYSSIVNDHIIWRFCGGFFIVSESLVEKYYSIIMHYLEEYILGGRLTWEVNIWAVVELIHKVSSGWYLADHNDTIIDIPLL